ncbi:hypothetical protein RGUI_1424 [Rhodovulum sp. P5]|nr:hypothetical protein RGUI_1424 [Rhodovulum sp. P5]
MTYYYDRYYDCEKKYEWSAFSEDAMGGNIGCGAKFTMPGSGAVCMSTYDGDRYLSGDDCYNERSSDRYGQDTYIDGAPVGAKMYAECYHVLKDGNGNVYYLIEIEVEGCNGEGDYFAFYGNVPAAGTDLTVVNTCNVSGNLVDFNCLATCEEAHNTPPTFSDDYAANCITVDENTTFVIDVDASDADGDALTYSIEGGDDAAFFTIDASTGELTFKTAPDYENPQDVCNDNTYKVLVKVDDGKGGTATQLLTVCVNDVAEGNGSCTVIEAEDMELCGYTVEGRGDASDGAGIKLCSSTGYASTTYKGEAGALDLSIDYMDESDGQGRIEVYVVNNCGWRYVETICLNKNDDGNGCDGSSSWSTATIAGVELEYGDKIVLKGVGDCGEYARIDKIELCEPDCAPCVTIEAEDMTAYGFTTVCGTQASGGELVKLACGTGRDVDGTLSTTFKGCDGTYDFKIVVQDECDGQSTLTVKVNGVEVGTIILNEDDDGSGSDNGGFSEFTLQDLELGYGDVLTIEADGDAGEYVRIDKIELCKDDQPATGAIKGRVFEDTNGDNTEWLNDGSNTWEPSVVGVTVILLNAAGEQVAETTTGDDGWYSFDNLVAGDYYVQFPTEIDGLTLIEQGVGDPAGGDSNEDSDADPTTGVTQVITVNTGETVWNIDAGIADPGTASITGTVFSDNDGSDTQTTGDTPISGVEVELFNGDGTTTGLIATTDSNGTYSFTGLPAGDYYVVFPETVDGKTLVAQDAGDDAIDSDAGTDGQTATVSVGIGETADLDAGYADPGTASITGTVFSDNDGSHTQTTGDTPISGVEVVLFNGDGTTTGLTATTGDDGTYSFTGLPAGDYYVVFPETVDGKTLVAQDAGDDAIDSDAGTDGQTATVSVGIGETADLDAGYADPETASITGTVFSDNDGSDTQTTGDTPISGVEVELFNGDGTTTGLTATTDSNGTYSFTGLPAGDYYVVFPETVDGKTLVAQDAGDDAIDSDAGTDGQTATVSVGIGETADLDAGYADPETASITGTVFSDNDGSDTQTTGDTPISGVEVELFNGDGTTTGLTATTDSNGTYSFTGLPAGDYYVVFPETVDGKTLVAQDAGDDAIDSDAGTDGQTATVSVGIGETADLDAGYADPETASIGDIVWQDENGNGVQDAGELGLDDVTVTLLADTDGDGDIDDIVATTQTANGGKYLFSGLAAGTYIVDFDEPNGFHFTEQYAGVDDEVDSNADVTTGATDEIVIGIGEEVLTIDAGLNADPDAVDDTAGGCADEVLVVDVLGNDSDDEGDAALSIVAIGGQSVSDLGDEVTLSGTVTSTDGVVITFDDLTATLTADGIEFDASSALADLDIGDHATLTVSYTISDGTGGTDTADMTLSFCGDANSYASLAETFPATADLIVTGALADAGAFNVTVSGSGDDRFDGESFTKAYCLSFTDPIPLNTAVSGDVFGLADAELFEDDEDIFDNDQVSSFNGNTPEDNLDLIQYIVAKDWNADANFSNVDDWDIQFAIWELTDTITSSDYTGYSMATESIVDAILADADANGHGYSFEGDGNVAGFIWDPNPEVSGIQQPFIVAFDFDAVDCIC